MGGRGCSMLFHSAGKFCEWLLDTLWVLLDFLVLTWGGGGQGGGGGRAGEGGVR